MTASVLIFENGLQLIAQLEEVGGDIGEPDCKLVDPYVITSDGTLEPWLVTLTTQYTFKIHSDKILTIAEPNSKLSKKYKELTETKE